MDIINHSVTALGLVVEHTHHLWKCFPTTEALRKGAFSQECKGFAEVRFPASHRTTAAEARAQSPTNDAAASAARPALHAVLLFPVHCSPGKFSSKMGKIYQTTTSLSQRNGSPAGWILPASCRHREHSQFWNRFFQGPLVINSWQVLALLADTAGAAANQTCSFLGAMN